MALSTPKTPVTGQSQRPKSVSKHCPVFTHAAQRALARYGLELTPAIAGQMLEICRSDDDRLINRTYYPKRRRWRCALRYGKQIYRVVTDSAQTVIITFLPAKRKASHAETVR